MRILGAVFFLSLLAGKFATFEQMLQIKHFLKKGVCVLKAPVFFFFKFFGGKIFYLKQPLARIELTKFTN